MKKNKKQKKYIKFVSLLLVFVFMFSLTSFVFADTDLSNSDTIDTDIFLLPTNGISATDICTGKTDTYLNPKISTTFDYTVSKTGYYYLSGSFTGVGSLFGCYTAGDYGDLNCMVYEKNSTLQLQCDYDGNVLNPLDLIGYLFGVSTVGNYNINYSAYFLVSKQLYNSNFPMYLEKDKTYSFSLNCGIQNKNPLSFSSDYDYSSYYSTVTLNNFYLTESKLDNDFGYRQTGEFPIDGNFIEPSVDWLTFGDVSDYNYSDYTFIDVPNLDNVVFNLYTGSFVDTNYIGSDSVSRYSYKVDVVNSNGSYISNFITYPLKKMVQSNHSYKYDIATVYFGFDTPDTFYRIYIWDNIRSKVIACIYVHDVNGISSERIQNLGHISSGTDYSPHIVDDANGYFKYDLLKSDSMQIYYNDTVSHDIENILKNGSEDPKTILGSIFSFITDLLSVLINCFKTLFSFITSSFNSISGIGLQLKSFLSSVFGFLPYQLNGAISASFAVVLCLVFFKILRG